MVAGTAVFALASLLGVVSLKRSLVDVTGEYDERRLATEVIGHARAAGVELESESVDRVAMATAVTESLHGLDEILASRAGRNVAPADRVTALASHTRTWMLAALKLTREEPPPAQRQQWRTRMQQWIEQSIGMQFQLLEELDAAGARAAALRRASTIVAIIGMLAVAMLVAQVWHYRTRECE
jgi:hypothetical protein